MKRVLVILLAFALFVPTVCYAGDDFKTDVALCYDGDAYSVDYVFEVTGDATITDVTLNDKNCYFEWNYVASGDVIARAEKITTVVSDAETELLPISIIVNGKVKKDVYASHESVEMEGLDPTIDFPGYTRSEKCERCDLILVEQEFIPALGPSVDAELDEDGILTVSGELSDEPAAEGITLIVVYDESNKMLCFADVTDLDQTDFSIQIEDAEDAHLVKVIRFDESTYSPLHQAAEADVK